MTRQKKTSIGVELLKVLARRGHRIFDLSLAKQCVPEVGMSPPYLEESISHLKKNGWIYSLKKGLYAMDVSFLGGIPIHEHEIAMFLVKPAIISHFSAFQYHGLSDQIPHVVYVSTLSNSLIPRLSAKSAMGYLINGVPYQFIKVKEKYFFGFDHRWEGSTKIMYTDYEKTLLDGLSRPYLCGGIHEVLHSFQAHLGSIDLSKIIDYSLRLEIATIKRLGWTLDQLQVNPDLLEPLRQRPISSYNKLNVSGDANGNHNKKWMIIENV